MARIVCNSSPIIGLSIINKVHLLWEIFDEVYVPEAVYQEVVSGNRFRSFGERELKEAVKNGHIRIHKVTNVKLAEQMSPRLHQGEVEVIIAAQELSIKLVVIDDKLARDFADAMLLQTVGIIGILVIAKKIGKIDEVKKYMDELIDNGYWISKTLYLDVMKRVGEDN